MAFLVNNEELIKLAQGGDASAEEKLLVANDRFCYHIAKKFENTGLEIDDLASLARIGLIKSTKKFDTSKNIKFITFASKVMINEILMFLRQNKKHTINMSNLEDAIAGDDDGGNLTLMEIIPQPEPDINSDNKILMQYVLDKFNEKASERDIFLLKEYLIGEKTQLEMAKILGISQSYVARRIGYILNRLKHIANYGKDIKSKNKKDDKQMNAKIRQPKQYTKEDYVYIFRTFPELKNKEVADLMGIKPQAVATFRGEFKRGKYDDLVILGPSPKLTTKIDEYVKKKVNDEIETQKKIEEATHSYEIEVMEDDTPIGYVIEDVKEQEHTEIKEFTPENDNFIEEENIILNNQISITSNKKEITNLIYGIFELLDKTPDDSKVKLDMVFQVIK